MILPSPGWNPRPGAPILSPMADTVNDTKAPADWLESLDRSQAQAEAGETVPLEPVLDRLRASIARMKAKRSEENRQAACKA
jgi:hypothetical protein